jgi:hypothetical protein
MHYRPHCDRLFFATTGDVPREIFPPGAGLIIADAFGASIMRDAPSHAVTPGARKRMMLVFARAAALRLAALIDPEVLPGSDCLV